MAVKIDLDVFEKMRMIITKSEDDLKDCIATVEKFKPQNVTESTHRSLMSQVIQSEMLLELQEI
jgi:hypothetical protein